MGKEPWETPIGQVVKGMDVVDSWYTGYGELKDFNENGGGVDQQLIYEYGNRYLREHFPDLDYIIDCSITDTNHVHKLVPVNEVLITDSETGDDIMLDAAASNAEMNTDL